MGCNCKYSRREIEDGKKVIAELRELFIRRMTVDSDNQDRRRKDFNQAIFHYYDEDSIDIWNKSCEMFGLPKRSHRDTYLVWGEIDMDMVLRCFDDAVKDWRKTFCDVENCKRKDG